MVFLVTYIPELRTLNSSETMESLEFAVSKLYDDFIKMHGYCKFKSIASIAYTIINHYALLEILIKLLNHKISFVLISDTRSRE